MEKDSSTEERSSPSTPGIRRYGRPHGGNGPIRENITPMDNSISTNLTTRWSTLV
ncbi:MAG: hypothetical protein ACLT8C_06780 [Akkermansia muciniphila]